MPGCTMKVSEPCEYEICNALAASGLFDADFYLEQNPDVAQTGIDPLEHYVRYGEKEGRRPNAGFDLQKYAHLYDKNRNILLQYIQNPEIGKKPKSVVPVVFSLNENFIPYFSVALASLADNRAESTVCRVFVMHYDLEPGVFKGLFQEKPAGIEIIPVNVKSLADRFMQKAWVSSHLSVETYFRFLIPRLLPDYDKVLYLDCDLLVLSDLEPLYRMSLDDCLLAGVREEFLDNDYFRELKSSLPEGLHKDYCNAGVLLINNRAFREENTAQLCMEHIKSGKEFKCHDQDILNICCRNRIRHLDLKWNLQWHYLFDRKYKYFSHEFYRQYAQAFNEPAIIHFSSGKKPWNSNDGHFAAYFWKYAAKSPYYDKIKAGCPYNPARC